MIDTLRTGAVPARSTRAIEAAPAAPPPRRAGDPAPGDTLELSDQARALALSAEHRASDVRAERVAALRSRVQAGVYYIPDALLAQRILEFRA